METNASGLLHPLRRGTIEDLDWNDEWLAILVEHNWRIKDGRTYLVIYSMPDLVEAARVEVSKYAREVEIVSGADLVAIHGPLSVDEIYRLPDLTEAWRDLPTFYVNAQGDISRRGAVSHPDIETRIGLGFPLFCRDDGTVFGSVRCHNTYRNETPHPAGLMEVRFDNRQPQAEYSGESAGIVDPVDRANSQQAIVQPLRHGHGPDCTKSVRSIDHALRNDPDLQGSA